MSAAATDKEDSSIRIADESPPDVSAPDWHIGHGHLRVEVLTGRLRAEQMLPQGCSVGHCPGLCSVEAEQLRRRAGESGEDGEDFGHDRCPLLVNNTTGREPT
jgi:hypothetical protein